MPGILPMKMIRVGPSTQSRIAQACDRCRSKKIRCDGVRPCCTQCANVGFECKTSDKLSRRAFPRGYTESLEDRVRGLEAEVRDLKILLDEKDEKIDVLSRIHNFSTQNRKPSTTPSTSAVLKAEEESPQPQEDVMLVELPAAVHPTSSFNGTSTTAALLEAFEGKVRDGNHSCPDISPIDLMKPHHVTGTTNAATTSTMVAPPRLLSDQYINIFFQEWQPLLPILHRPNFLRTYEQYLLDPTTGAWKDDKHAISQMYLIFEIAAHSSSSRTRPATKSYEMQWRMALSSISSTPSIASIQSHLLAQLCYLLKADHSRLLRHRACAVSMVHQLFLHQGHKNQSIPIFDAETRKKVFWCQYVLDKFISATTGTPQLLREVDVSAEYPTDVDDENINAQGVSPVLPGELTKMSSALALFKVSRILAKSLEDLYPSQSSYQLSLTKLYSLSDELDQWQEDLPDHLRLRFCNDKPATNIIGCRSPLLSLAYFYIRSLIHRPLLCHGHGKVESAATIILAAAAKHELQILDLLDERSMNYTFPVSKQDVLLNAGFAILWQSMGLENDSRLIKDNQRSVTLLVAKLYRENRSVSSDFQKIAASFLPSSDAKSGPFVEGDDLYILDGQISTSKTSEGRPRSTRKQLQAMASRLSSFNGKSKNADGTRRASMSQPASHPLASSNAYTKSTTSVASAKSAPTIPTPISDLPLMAGGDQNSSVINLDYFPITDDFIDLNPNVQTNTTPTQQRIVRNTALHKKLDTRINNSLMSQSPETFDTVSPLALNKPTPLLLSGEIDDWSQDLWHISTYDIAPRARTSQSQLSFSGDSLTSGDDFLFSATGSHNGSTSCGENMDISSNTRIPA